MSTFTRAVNIAAIMHTNQKDKGGEDYLKHPLHLAYKCKARGHSNDVQIVAVLHDVIEDSCYTFEDLEAAGFSKDIIDALKLLTHDKDEDYFEYISKIKENDIARKVKIEDLLHNSDIRRIPPEKIGDAEKIMKMFVKYSTALNMLKD